MHKIRKAVIPAAGLGSRFYPLTRAQPKEMLPLVDKPIIHYVVEEAIASGLDEILIIVGAGKDAIINYFDSSGLDQVVQNDSFSKLPEIYFVRQRQLLGLADSIRYARKFVDDEPFAVLLGDTVYTSDVAKTVTQQMLDLYEKRGKPIIALERVPPELVMHYGMVEGIVDSEGILQIRGLIEKPSLEKAPSDLGITGLYALTPEIFEYIDRLKPGRNNELQLTDALRELAQSGNLLGFEISGTRYDMGDMELWIKTFVEFIRRDKRYSKLLG